MTDFYKTQSLLDPSAKAQEHVKILGELLITIRLNAEAVSNQPDFSPEAVDCSGSANLNTYLGKMRAYAMAWNDKYQEIINSTLQELIAYSNTFKAYSGVLAECSKQGLTGANLANFEKGLKLLQKQAANAKQLTNTSRQEIAQYHSELAKDSHHLKLAVEKLISKLDDWQVHKDKFLFAVGADYVSELQQNQIPNELLTVFEKHNERLAGSLIVTAYKANVAWVISEVHYNDAMADNYQDYAIQRIYILELENNQLNAYMGKASKSIQQKARYEADLAGMQHNTALIATEAITKSIDKIVIYIGAIGNVSIEETTYTAIDSGVVVTNSGIVSKTYGTIDYTYKASDARQTLMLIAQDEPALPKVLLAILLGLMRQIHAFSDGVKQANTALSSLVYGWQELEAEMIQLQEAVKDAKSSDKALFIKELDGADNSWNTLASMVNTIFYHFAHLEISALHNNGMLDSIYNVSNNVEQ